MHSFLLFCNFVVLFGTISGSFINQYRKHKCFEDDGDPGAALYLTKYIECGDIKTAQNLSLVLHPDISIKNYAGYFTVNKEYNSNLFFWVFPAKINAADAPVLLWLQGGPGSSSLTSLFLENGPYSISPAQKLIPREYSWHLNHNLIYIDNPVGTGFSFTESDDGYAKNEIDVGENLLNALQQFFSLFPNLQKNEFFVGGESYGGKYVPAVGLHIHQDNQRKTDNLKINLKGLIIGNGFSDPVHQLNYGDYLYQLGLIDTNGLREFIKYENRGIDCIKKRDFECALEVFDKMFDNKAHSQGCLIKNLTGFNSYFNFLKTDDDSLPIDNFIQKSDTRRAIHVRNNPFSDPNAMNKLENYIKYDIMVSVAPWVAELLSHYPILIYNGQLDIMVPYPMTENYMKHLNFAGAEQYRKAVRHIWRVDDAIAGYVKHRGNLTRVLVRNAGHMVPYDQSKWALDMILRFTHKKCLH